MKLLSTNLQVKKGNFILYEYDVLTQILFLFSYCSLAVFIMKV